MSNKGTIIKPDFEKIGVSTDEILNEENILKVTESGIADDVLKKYEYLQITNTTQIPPPVVVLKINGETICTEGNITTISGASKSGKSAFITVPIAGAISNGDYDGFPDVEVAPCNGKAVIHFDTEQARYKHQRNLNSILRRAGLENCPENFLSYNIRQEDLKDYSSITEEIVRAANDKFGGVHLIVVDGGADYIKDVNDPTQSNAIVKFFEDLAIKYSAVVIIIIHVNPNGDKERGHLGSQLQRKSESVLSIKTQADISCLEPKHLRMAGKGNIPLLQFIYDKEKGYHVFCGVKPKEDQENILLRKQEEISDLVMKVFILNEPLIYKDAIDKIMKTTGKAIATAKNLFSEMNKQKMITQNERKLWQNNLLNEPE